MRLYGVFYKYLLSLERPLVVVLLLLLAGFLNDLLLLDLLVFETMTTFFFINVSFSWHFSLILLYIFLPLWWNFFSSIDLVIIFVSFVFLLVHKKLFLYLYLYLDLSSITICQSLENYRKTYFKLFFRRLFFIFLSLSFSEKKTEFIFPNYIKIYICIFQINIELV